MNATWIIAKTEKYRCFGICAYKLTNRPTPPITTDVALCRILRKMASLRDALDVCLPVCMSSTAW